MVQQYKVEIEYSKKRKKSVALKITPQGVLIQAPSYYTEAKVLELVERKKVWIEESWKKFSTKLEKNKKEFLEGSLLPYLGKKYPLTLRRWQKKGVKFGKTEDLFVAYINRETTQEQLLKGFEKWEKSKALSLIAQKTQVLGRKFGLIPEQIFIKRYTSKYGMCKGKDVYFDFKIIELPEGVLEHIILHELTHLTHKHHQKRFREKLASMDENWKKHRDFLRGKMD